MHKAISRSEMIRMCARAFDFGWAGVCFKTVCTLDIHEASPRYSALTADIRQFLHPISAFSGLKANRGMKPDFYSLNL